MINKDYRQDLVSDFMVKGKQWDGETLLSSTPNQQELETYKLRLKLSIEETFELFEAMLTERAYKDKFENILNTINSEIASISSEQAEIKPVDIFDSLVDQDYVNIGLANLLGLDMKAGFQEVQHSNLSKFGPEGIPTFREDGKVLKDPRTYVEPNLAEVYKKSSYTYTGFN